MGGPTATICISIPKNGCLGLPAPDWSVEKRATKYLSATCGVPPPTEPINRQPMFQPMKFLTRAVSAAGEVPPAPLKGLPKPGTGHWGEQTRPLRVDGG